MKLDHFLKPAPKSLKPSKFHKKQEETENSRDTFFCVLFLLSLFLGLCFSCVFCFLCVFSLFLFFSVLFLICFIFSNFYLFLDPCRKKMKKVCPPPYPFIKCLKCSHCSFRFSINWSGRYNWVTTVGEKKTNSTTCQPPSKIIKMFEPTQRKVRRWLALYMSLSSKGVIKPNLNCEYIWCSSRPGKPTVYKIISVTWIGIFFVLRHLPGKARTHIPMGFKEEMGSGIKTIDCESMLLRINPLVGWTGSVALAFRTA